MFIVFTTTNSIEEARKLASLFVKKKVAGCVQIVPSIESVYEWDDKIETESECLLLIKTTEDKIDELKHMLDSEHSYDVPEFICVEADKVSDRYGKWLNSVTRSQDR